MTRTDASRQAFYSIIMSLSGFLLFSIADTCVKYLGIQGYHTHIIQAYASGIATLLCVAYILIHKKTFRAFKPRKSWRLHIIRSFTLVIAIYFLIESLRLLGMAEFYSIAFLIPFLVTIGSAIFFREDVGLWRWVAIFGGLIGVLIAVSGQLSDVENISGIGMIYAFLMVIGLTISYLIIRKMGPGEYAPIFPFYAQIGILIANIILIIIYKTPLPVIPLTELPIWLLYGGSLFCAVLLVSSAFANAPIVAVPACFQYTQIIWGVLFGYLFFTEMPQFNTIIGLSVITASGLFMVWREYIAAKTKKVTVQIPPQSL